MDSGGLKSSTDVVGGERSLAHGGVKLPERHLSLCFSTAIVFPVLGLILICM